MGAGGSSGQAPAGPGEVDLSSVPLDKIPDSVAASTSVKCASASLKEVPPRLLAALANSKSIKSLVLSSNELACVPAAILNIPSLSTLNLANNKLAEIALQSSKVKTLDISFNKFTALPFIPDTVTDLCFSFNTLPELTINLPNVSRLICQMTGLAAISPTINLCMLETLDLSKNSLTDVPDFAKVSPNLRLVDLSDNMLTAFPSFPPSVVQIYLRNNSIPSIPANIREAFPTLTYLDCAANCIQSIPPLPPMIETLVLYQNQIAEIAPGSYAKLKAAFLSNNRLSSYPPLNSNSITDLQVQSNLIKTIDTNYLSSSLSFLDVSFNLLEAIPAEVFQLPSLKTFRAFYNKISAIPDISNSHIASLNISGNPIKSFCSPISASLKSFFASDCSLASLQISSSFLEELVVDNNSLTVLPSLPSLHLLHASYNSLDSIPVFPLLKDLDISHNSILSIPDPFTFAILEEFSIAFNKIATFPSVLFAPKLETVNISCNPIECDVNPDILTNLHQFDAVETKIHIKGDFKTRQLCISDRTISSNLHAIIQIISEKCSYSEMRGFRDGMEDSIIVRPKINSSCDLYAVLDGHGGSKTSLFSAMKLQKSFEVEGSEINEAFVRGTVESLEQSLIQHNLSDGATMALVIRTKDSLILAHLGDARAIVFSSDQKVQFFTKDHKPTVRSEFERIRSEGGKVVSNRTNGLLAVSRSLGDNGVPGVSHSPDVSVIPILPDTKWVVICCDGVFDVLTNEMIGEIISKSSSPTDIAFSVRNKAFACCSTDNISVVVADISN